ncbi:MAG: hypothetical protein MZW92_13035 [Comamonadaceae bacterium]|nr:hypothetical protein [Comamonadaceae bacterium]
MTLARLPAADLRLSVDPRDAGLCRHLRAAGSSRCPGSGRSAPSRPPASACRWTQPDYNLFVLGEVGSGRTLAAATR